MQIVHHLFCQQAFTLSSLSPKLRIVSIIPGMEIFAPLRTDTNNKLSSEEKAFPVRLEKLLNDQLIVSLLL